MAWIGPRVVDKSLSKNEQKKQENKQKKLQYNKYLALRSNERMAGDNER